jgi:putative peptidoglycan lipid II flippase
MTVLSRIGGLARDATLSRVFGIGPMMDAFFFGFMVPNLFRRLFGEGALSAAFLPIFVRESDDDPATARAMARLLIGRAMFVLAAIVLVIEALVVTGIFGGTLEFQSVGFLAIMLPYAPLVCLVALVGAMLQAYGKFGPTAASPIILNALLVVTTLILVPAVDGGWMSREAQVIWVAVSVLVAGLIQVAWSLAVLRGVMPRGGDPDLARAHKSMRGVFRQAIPMALGLGALQLNTLMDGIIASWPTIVGPTIPFTDIAYPLPEGSMSSLSWAARLYEFPLGVFGIAIATAIFPQLSRQHGSQGDFLATLRRGLRLTFFIGLPASIGLVLVRDPLTAVILQGSAFTVEDTRRTAFILLGYAPAIWAYSLSHVLVRAFYARGEAMTAVKVSVGLIALNLLLNLTLIWTPLGVAGLAWSTALCAIVQTIVLSRLLARRVGPILDRAVLQSAGRTVLLTLVVAVSAVAVLALIDPERNASSWWLQLGGLCAVVFAGMLAAFLVASLLRMPELDWVLRGSDR